MKTTTVLRLQHLMLHYEQNGSGAKTFRLARSALLSKRLSFNVQKKE
jgi:hypothetical protein